MTTLFRSNDPQDWGTTGMTWPVNTTTSNFDNTRVPWALNIGDDTSDAANWQNDVPSGTVVWYNFRMIAAAISTAAEDGHLANILDGAGNFVGRLSMNNGLIGCQVSGNGTTFGAKVDGSATTKTTLQAMDIKMEVTGANVTMTLFINSTQEATATVANGSTLGVARQWDWDTTDSADAAFNQYVSEFFVADTDTRGKRMSMLQATTAGNYTAWTGAIGTLSDNDYDTGMESVVANDRQGANFDTYSGGAAIDDVSVVVQIKEGLGAPTQAQSGVRISTTDYDGSNVTLAGTTRVEKTFLLDPSTVAAWDVAGVNACQLQFQAIA